MNLTMNDMSYELLERVSKNVLNQLKVNSDMNLIEFENLYSKCIDEINAYSAKLTISFKGRIKTDYLIGSHVYDGQHNSVFTLAMHQDVDCVLNLDLTLRNDLIHANLDDLIIGNVRHDHSKIFKTSRHSSINLSDNLLKRIKSYYMSKVRTQSEKDFRFTGQYCSTEEVISRA